MKKIKSWKNFNEDATATTSSTGGMGGVSPAAVGGLPGVGSTPGSGDLGFSLYDKGKNKKVKKGNPSQVTDMRFLAPTKGITKVKESIEWKEFSDDEKEIIQDCLVDLTDNGFKLTSLNHNIDVEKYDKSEDETASFQDEEIRISLHKMIESNWTGNINVRGKFNKSEITKKVQTLRGRGEKLTPEEESLVGSLSDLTHQMINQLNYRDGYFDICYQVTGSSREINHPRYININVHIVLNRHVYE
jgi:hypothetical protein